MYIKLFKKKYQRKIIKKYLLFVNRRRPRVITRKKLEFEEIPENNFYDLFRFSKQDFLVLFKLLRMPIYWKFVSGHVVEGRIGFCIFLRRLSSPNTLKNMEEFSCFHYSTISRVFNAVTEHIYNLMKDRIHFDYVYLSEARVARAAFSVTRKVQEINPQIQVTLTGCWDFIDGTVRAIARPTVGQEGSYNGHHREHALKFQAVLMADGMIVSMAGPYPGNRHDVYMLRESNLISKLQSLPFENERHFIYGDAGYNIQPHLVTGYAGINLTPYQKLFNRTMSFFREPVEWSFKDIIQKWGFLRDKWNLKTGLQPVGTYYLVAAILTNCHNCFYPNQASQYFNCRPGTIYEYLCKLILKKVIKMFISLK